MSMKKYFAIIIMTLILVSACNQIDSTKDNEPKTTDTSTELSATQELKKFESMDEIVEFLNKQQSGQNNNYMAKTFGGGTRTMAAMEMVGAPMADMAGSVSGGSDGATDYSQTNVQVIGVDEADFVKNDDKYIYTLSGTNLVIVNAYPAENAKVLSETEIKGNPTNMFINDNKLIIFSNDNEQIYRIAKYDFMPRPRHTQSTHVMIYNIEDKEDPELIKDFSLNGNYYQSRMIGNHIYFIVNENVYHYNNFVDLPMIRENGKALMSPEIYYFDNPEQNYNFVTVSSLNVDDDEIESKSYMMGYSNTLYVSLENIYITYQKNVPYNYRGNEEERFTEVILPILPKNTRDIILNVLNTEKESYTRWNKISDAMEEMYNRMDEDDQEYIIDEIAEKVQEYEIKREIDRRKTVIQKINIDNGKITYDTKGEVPGHLHNQFSLDEYEGNLRVATTVQAWGRGESILYNNVYVLDDDLDVIGQIEDIAPDESIYSTRFLGDRLYMVTFKRIDPFFVISLKDPKNPEILGKLKIPGYSDYLHPYDENTIIGIGKETEGNQWGGISTAGVKIALFDVSDVNNPEEIDKIEIGSQGTDSEALHEHKAFLFDKKRNLLVIPVREVKERRIYDPVYNYYRNRVWQGAYVFEVTKDDIDKKGKITHMESIQDEHYYYQTPHTVRRSLFMDNVLYTISGAMIKANEIDDLDEIKEIELPYESNDRNYPYPGPIEPRMMIDDGGIEVREMG